MKITKSKVKRELIKKGWLIFTNENKEYAIADSGISDTLNIINDILIAQKGISIK
jgi:hypothetical protein